MALSSPNNIETLIAAGWDIPTNVWMDHPTAAAIKSSLIAPFQNDGGGICVKRLWLPHVLSVGNTDATQLSAVSATANSMHRRAIAAWKANDIDVNPSLFTSYMAEAKASFNTQCDAKIASGTAFSSFVVLSVPVVSRDAITALLALDWILWDDAAEFEAAFQKVLTIIQDVIDLYEASGTHWRAKADLTPGDGYWHASTHSTTTDYLKGLLALSVYGVNPGGVAHLWANDAIDHMGLDPTNDPTAIYSPFDDHNVANLLSLGNGGGREWGAHANVTSFGGYELNIAWTICFLSRAVDTATNSAFSMVDNNLYIQTRHEGLTAIENLPVEVTGFHGTCAGMVEVWARLLNGSNAGGVYSWLTNRSALHASVSSLRVLQAISGPKASPVSPSGPVEKRIGSRFYYIEDSALPDSTFRVMNHHRSLDAHRELGDERVMRFGVGAVGLVEGHCNRSAPNGVTSNGVWVGNKWANGTPKFCQVLSSTVQWWAQGMSKDIYHQSIKPNTPFALATDARYLVGSQPKPSTVDNVTSWTQDWTEWAGVYDTASIVTDARWTGAVTQYVTDKINHKQTITDTITVDLNDGLYLGWHFSPSHTPTFPSANVMEITDGTDLVRVTVTPIGAFGLTRTVRTEFDFDGVIGDLEWHDTGEGGSINRIAANVGFVPDTITVDNVYEVEIKIEANPAPMGPVVNNPIRPFERFVL